MAKAIKGMFGTDKTGTIVQPKKKKEERSDEEKAAIYEQHKAARKLLKIGNLREAVRLPLNEDENEWIAVNTVDFFNQINLLYGSITQFCTKDECNIMSAGPKFEYLWADGVNFKTPVPVSAPEYVEYLLSWVQSFLDDDKVFPKTADAPFPRNFTSTVKQIFKRLFRVYAHIYYSHFEQIVKLDEEAHINTCFLHFYYFIREFHLVDKKEMLPLADLIKNLTAKDDASSSSASSSS